MPTFRIEHLDDEKLLDAWPIVRSAGAEPLPDWWENEALELMRRGGGVLAARAPDGSIHGVATYECLRRSACGPVLAVGRLVSFELNRRQPVRKALCDALQAIAAAFCCSAVVPPVRATRGGQHFRGG